MTHLPKQTGLMFQAPLVRAILEGRKTQTRRIVTPQPAPNHPHDGGTKWISERGLHIPVGSIGHLSVQEKMGLRCPMGQPGDLIYVRETWQVAGGNSGIWYAATDSTADEGNSPVTHWKPSIHMPKALARIWLEITGVRVERLQAITTADCIAEGLSTTQREYDAEVHLRDQFQEL